VVAEHDSEGSFRPEYVLTLFLRTHTTGMVKSLGNVCQLKIYCSVMGNVKKKLSV